MLWNDDYEDDYVNDWNDWQEENYEENGISDEDLLAMGIVTGFIPPLF